MIILDNVSIKYWKNTILENIDMYILDGKISVLEWVNWAWKSTLINSFIWKKQVSSWKIIYWEWFHWVFSYMSQDNYLFEHLTCYQNLEIIFSWSQNTWSLNLCNDFLNMFNITKLKEKYPHEISIGQRQILCFIRCLLVDSEYLILDEPTSALDEKNRNKMIDILKKLKAKWKTIFIISHDYEFINSVADKNYIIKNKTIIKK